jgi:flagellar protein FliS
MQSARQNYLQADVSTATPQKLQLLLIEAAIKNIHRTKQCWKDQRFDDGVETLSRAQDIITEILCSLDREGNPEIAKKLASIYLFIFRRLAEGGMSHDEQKLDDALRILGSERETWRLVCEKFGSMVGQTSSLGGGISSSVRLELSSAPPSAASVPTNNNAKVLVSPLPANNSSNNSNSIGSGVFHRPLFSQGFGLGVKPLGASGGQPGIRTDSSLAEKKTTNKTPDPPPKKTDPKTNPPTNPKTGNSWDA